MSVEERRRSLRAAAAAVERHEIIPVLAGTVLDILATQPAREAQEPVAWEFEEPGTEDPATALATTIMAMDWKPRGEWSLDEQADRHGELQVIIDKAIAPPPDAAATIARLEKEMHATVRKFNCDNAEQFWRNIGKLRERAETAEAELASLREKAKADVAAEREACGQAAEDACATPPSDFAGMELEAFHRGADAMNDTVVAAIRARAALTPEEG